MCQSLPNGGILNWVAFDLNISYKWIYKDGINHNTVLLNNKLYWYFSQISLLKTNPRLVFSRSVYSNCY